MSLDKVTRLPLKIGPSVLNGFGENPQKLWSSLPELCEALHIPISPRLQHEERLFQHVHFKAGQRICTIGQKFDALYIVHSGFLKTVIIDEIGEEQILRFPMKHDVVGVEGFHENCYASEVVALTECNLIVLPITTFTRLCRANADFEHALFGLISRDLAEQHAMAGMLGACGAAPKIASFLVAMAARFSRIGFSEKLFRLRMTRQDIGNYLGLRLETVSRTFTQLSKLGLITVNQRLICIQNGAALKALSMQSFREHISRPNMRKAILPAPLTQKRAA